MEDNICNSSCVFPISPCYREIISLFFVLLPSLSQAGCRMTDQLLLKKGNLTKLGLFLCFVTSDFGCKGRFDISSWADTLLNSS